MDENFSKMRDASRRSLVRLAWGFFMVTLVMGAVVFVAQLNMKSMHYDLESFIGDENEEVELIQTLRHVVRERMILMNQMALEDDPFKRDELIQQFEGFAGEFIQARHRLEEKASSGEEKANLAELQRLTQKVTPLNDQVVALLAADKLPEAKHLLLTTAMPAQQKVMAHTERMLQFHKHEADQIEKAANAHYQRDSFVLVILGGLAASLSWIISVRVLDSAWKDRLALVGEIGRRAEAEQQLVLARDNLEEEVKQRTADLQSTAAQLEEAQRIAHIGHFDWKLSEGTLFWSDEIYSMFGLPKSEGASREKFMQIVHPDDQAFVQQSVDKALHEAASFDIAHRIVRPDGAMRVVHLQGEVSYGADCQPARMLGTIQDITESREAENKVRLAASVFENAGEGIMITDRNNNIVDINQAFTEITGFKREEVLGENPRLFKSGKHDPAFYREMWNTLLEKGQWQGELWGRRKSGTVFPKWQTINIIRDESNNITNHIAIFRDISDAKRNEEKLWQLAHFDNLTGVANRSLMYANLRQAIAQARRSKRRVALMLFDLDGFKQVNDTLGHDAGDELLKHVANQLRATVRESDTVARLGGDEFTTVLVEIHAKEDVERVAGKIQSALGKPFNLKTGETIVAKASIGIALYPDDAPDIESLMKNADRAMYHAKELGKNNYQFFAEDMSEQTKPKSSPA